MRPCLQTTVRFPNGEPDPNADVEVEVRGTGINWPVYSAASGGSVVTQPFNPDADGNVTVYAAGNIQYDLRVTHSDGSVSLQPIDLVAASSDAWTAATLTSPFTNYGSGYVSAAYTLDALGVVHIRGMVAGGPGNVFTLPGGYRPAARVGFIISSLGVPARLRITAAGVVNVAGGSVVWDMQGVSFTT